MRVRQLKAIEAAAGTWEDEDHPELKAGAAKYIGKVRNLDERRIERRASSPRLAT
jgi:hypothetical protein